MSKYSDGRFGLTAQKEVYQALSKKNPDLDAQEMFIQFANAVGWIRDGEFISYPELFFDLDKAPKGHLPVKVPEKAIRPAFKSRSGNADRPRNYNAIIDRTEMCTP